LAVSRLGSLLTPLGAHDAAFKRSAGFYLGSTTPGRRQKIVSELNASMQRLNEMRAVEINVAGPFARSKIAWKLATYQHALLHRIVSLMDGTAVAWNEQCTLSAILSARAFMETLAVMSRLEMRVADLLKAEDLSGLDSIAQNGVFATRDEEMLKDFPDMKAINAVTYVDKYDQLLPGFKNHYDILSERCHPNSLGHNFMFSKLDRSNGSITYCDEHDPRRNSKMILAAIAPLWLVESLMARLDGLIQEVANLQHRLAPVRGKESGPA
jgi:hypothetical protein